VAAARVVSLDVAKLGPTSGRIAGGGTGGESFGFTSAAIDAMSISCDASAFFISVVTRTTSEKVPAIYETANAYAAITFALSRTSPLPGT
jgi:hypothetical protein